MCLSIKSRKILNSRGDWTVEVELKTPNGLFIDSCPSGASTGKYDSRVIAFRRAATVNTYAVTSPFLDNFNGSGILKNFFPGPDYGQVRILDTN